jgi:beta-carotene 15,15'-monooxygenase/beta,beta-carotene 9',10'-dioxygenase
MRSSVVFAASMTSAIADEAGWDLLATSVGAPDARACLPMQKLPSYVRGTYIVSGPAQFELNEYKFQGLFDGFGRVNRFEIGDGEVCFTSNWLNTAFRTESEKRGYPAGMLFEEPSPKRPSCPLLDLMCEMAVPSDNDWVNTLQVGDKTLLLTDAPQMLELDLETLEVKGFHAWTDDKNASIGPPVPDWIESMHMGTAGSAHPLKRPDSEMWVDVISSMGPIPGVQKSFLDIFTFRGDVSEPQARLKIASVELDQTPYLHSFGVTSNYAILPMNHKMGVPNFGHPVLSGLIEEHWAGLHLVDLNTGNVQAFGADFSEDQIFCHVHVVNSFENATGVTMDLGAYNSTPFGISGALNIPMFKDKSARDSNPVRNVVRRLHLHVSGDLAGQTTMQDFPQTPGSHSDFFRINPLHAGKAYCFYYATEWWHDGSNYANMAIVKRDVCKGGLEDRVYWSRPDVYPGEPMFVPADNGNEDDGTVVFIALDGQKERTLFVTLDAKTMSELDVVELPSRIPFTAHGQFFEAPKATELVL